MRLFTPKYIHFFEDYSGAIVVVPCQTVNHLTKTRRGKPFAPYCGKCGNARVVPLETHIQHGFDVDKHWYYVYCDICRWATIHIYEVSENGD